MTKCKIINCFKCAVSEELLKDMAISSKYIGYCLEHIEAREKEDRKFEQLEALEKEEEDDNNN